MVSEIPVRVRMLRVLLAMDAAVLFMLGALLMAMPGKVGVMFGFKDLAPASCYLIELWGCALLSLGFGYGFAVGDPVRDIAWVRVGIVRGGLECALGCMALAQHMVTWQQAALGTVVAGAMALGYVILYPAAEMKTT